MEKRCCRDVLVVGGTSEMALAVLQALPDLRRVLLIGRDRLRLEAARRNLAGGCGSAGPEISILEVGFPEPYRIREICGSLPWQPDLAVIAQGMLTVPPGDGGLPEMIRVNLTEPCLWISVLAEIFQDREMRLCVISSVAGDRGRGSNYAYGMTKAGLSAFTEGLASRLAREGSSLGITLVKPGLVDTVMIRQRRDRRLICPCSRAGRIIARGVLRGRGTVYVPWWWAVPGILLRLVPRGILSRIPW